MADGAVTPASEAPTRLVGLPRWCRIAPWCWCWAAFLVRRRSRRSSITGTRKTTSGAFCKSLWPQHPLPPAGPQHYAQRCAWLLERRLGLWDVYASCEREGSLDTSIRNAVVNDFAQLLRECPWPARHRPQWWGKLQAQRGGAATMGGRLPWRPGAVGAPALHQPCQRQLEL